MGRPAATTTATAICTFGAAPASLMGTSAPTVLIEGKPALTVQDTTALANIPSFGMCASLSNPTVAAATAAALGTLTPMPCVPVPTAWQGAATASLAAGKPALAVGATCPCLYGGMIQIIDPGSRRTQVG